MVVVSLPAKEPSAPSPLAMTRFVGAVCFNTSESLKGEPILRAWTGRRPLLRYTASNRLCQWTLCSRIREDVDGFVASWRPTARFSHSRSSS